MASRTRGNSQATSLKPGLMLRACERISDVLETGAFADVLSRVNAQLAAAKLASEIKAATTRISELVGAIKEYSYMDQASVQEVDVHKGAGKHTAHPEVQVEKEEHRADA